MKEIENTGLWKRSLGAQNSENVREYERLKTSFCTFRERASQLVSRISSDLPELTIHDISHLDALWGVADLIAGDDYPLNPLEAFVFGGAVLLHDAALCFEAYENGLKGIRENVYWQDAYATELKKYPDAENDECLKAADFVTIRRFHSARAADLAKIGWKTPNDHDIFLIDDTNLRSNFGEIIGLIASSHHWDIEKLLTSLPGQLNAPGNFPSSWVVDPIKIACLLRCADAAHIDSRRAPDFLYALVRRHGVSLQHWQAQNRLSQVGPSHSDPENRTLLFTSCSAFPIDEADAWWVAYDAICLVQRELQNSNQLLSSRLGTSSKSPLFKMQHVEGVDNPANASKHIRVTGWMPCSVSVHVSDMQRLIERLGGEQLYGAGCDKLKIVIREMLQNSRDAVVARRFIDEGYVGEISVRLSQFNGNWKIDIIDDGVGMSMGVLTGALLDFGSSFWSGNIVQDEFPGLRSSKFQSAGRFGIGFFSVFMAAKSVEVAARRYDAGLDAVNRLLFPKGLTLRPTLVSSTPCLGARESTRVSLILEDGLINENGTISVGGITGHQDKIPIDFNSYISVLVCGLDVNVNISHNNESTIHHSVAEITRTGDMGRWLRDIYYSRYVVHGALPEEIISKYDTRLRAVRRGKEILGYAAINSTFQNNVALSVTTIGGLESGRNSYFLGYMDYDPQSAKRDQGPKPRATADELDVWANEQMDILIKENAPKEELEKATRSFSDMGINPTRIFHTSLLVPIGNAQHQVQIVSMDEILAILKRTGIYLFASHEGGWEYCRHYDNLPYDQEGPTFIPLENSGTFYVLRRDSPANEPEYTFLKCVSDYVEANGCCISIDHGQPVGRTIFGTPLYKWRLTAS
ncbi:HD domain-containing protein [Methylobacter tundripaludum]|uniref:ATP-binding region ATPase domain protein n=1 Tax=Methylobacter tundripaludum (strain ATCC BAA-1195 / DSM 17260 / SV96) TaxID=697282 RepID=G3IU23_METTV|nr:ATP-binding protein [Methylobacter tundripaludum]EGW21506.1 ATP-binding region ATPase domain protein [Methylobacter tundripaludum SV96]